MPVVRRISALLALCGLTAFVFALPAAAQTASGGANQVVTVDAGVDGSWAARAGTQVSTFGGGNAWTSANIAAATSSNCNGCHATAVAVQVIFVTGSPSYAAPANVAAAANGGCTGCGSYAYAWQYWVQASGPVTLSPAGQQRVAELRGEIAAAAQSILPSDAVTDPGLTRDQQLDEKLDSLTAELKAVVDSELQAAGVLASGSLRRNASDAPGQ
jgi:hypothetical protein